QPISIAVISLHVLAAMFWAGTSFTLARTGGLGGAQLFRPQMGAATVAILAGGCIWQVSHAGAFDTAERVLALGAVCAIIAASVRSRLGQFGVRSGAPRGSWPGSAEAPFISPPQKWRITPSCRVKTLKAASSPPSLVSAW